ncbi:sensor histidine kinase [Pseudodesulfovibrio senegalensis]|uniref:histidine kinase n=1 Tax=Pseudodesulfovibrio senegalensis TaxID=1721087 RepID=A0A6N6N4T0_9BACT|nr:HAMP domain-containing sensor histidine kinase [Pseudodesulfovibrio senegalensis]KAB1442788.1 HAMP domain-containing protein [Pseudodesulfovibrio senegalensis]
MRLRSFQVRLLLWGWAVLLLALAAAFYYSSTLVGSELVRETETRSWKQLETVKWLLEEHESFAGEWAMDEWAKTLAAKMGSRITYIKGSDGRVIADSEVPFGQVPEMESHDNRPEVVAAREDGRGMNLRHSHTLGKDMIYVACRVSRAGGMPAGILRVAVPFSIVQARLDSLRINFLWIFLTVLLLAAGAGTYLSRNVGRSIRAFSEVARQIGEGNYSMRLRASPGGEFQPLARSVNAMAKRIEKHIQTIDEQRGQLRAMFEGMNEGVMVLDADGRLVAYNSALDEMISMPGTAVGRTPIEVCRRYEVQEVADQLLAEGGPDRAMAEIELMDGRTVDVSGVPYYENDGARKIILVFHDITVIRQAEKGLRDFVANASHQLRTPLTSIKGYSETLLDNPPAKFEDARSFLEIIVKNSDHMNKVISSMLALAKSEQVGKALQVSPVSGRDIFSRALDDLTPLGHERGIDFSVSMPDDDPLMVMGEPDGVLHVFHNLMQNAVKYSPDNGCITVEAKKQDGFVAFCVEDQGPGISKEHSLKVFERFYRVDENTIDGHGSAGLGLAICRRIVQNLGGEIWHDGYGEGARGARFCFRLKTPA